MPLDPTRSRRPVPRGLELAMSVAAVGGAGTASIRTAGDASSSAGPTAGAAVIAARPLVTGVIVRALITANLSFPPPSRSVRVSRPSVTVTGYDRVRNCPAFVERFWSTVRPSSRTVILSRAAVASPVVTVTV